MTEKTNYLTTRTATIKAAAEKLQSNMPTHLKLLPEIRQTLVVIQQISDVLHYLTQQVAQQQTTRGNPNANDN